MPPSLPADNLSPDNEPRLTRLPVDSPRRRDLITRGRSWLSWLGLLALLVWLVIAFWTGAAPRRYSPGPVADAHAAWDSTCVACHATSGPMSAGNWLTLFSGQYQQAADDQCAGCHQGPVHHATQKAADVPGCTECHREHRGRSASLVRVHGDLCTRCHTDLKSHLEVESVKQGPRFEDVRGFDGGKKHPPFRFERERLDDPGRLKFNHKLHLTRGMALTRGSMPYTLAQVDAGDRERYRQPGQKGDVPVELTCVACHRLDGADFRIGADRLAGLPLSPLLPARGAGAYMLPVTYELHCRACHPLGVERKDPEDPRSGLVTIPHRLQPPAIRELVEAHFTARVLRKPSPLLERPLRPLPHQDPEAKGQARKAREDILERVYRAETELYVSKKSCGECHHFSPAPTSLPPSKFDQLRVVPTQVPQVWLQHARFDHSAHRMVDCRACHPNAYPLNEDGEVNPQASDQASQVLLPGVATCARCHAPLTRSGGAVSGGARHDCVECHRYHGGDHPFHGLGADARGPAKPRVGVEGFHRKGR